MASINAEQRQKGTVYVARVRLPGGGTITKTFDKEKDAGRWAAILEGEKARHRLPPNLTDGRLKFSDYSKEWLATRQLRERTRDLYDDLLTRFIGPTFDNVMLSRISPQSVRRWHAACLAADDAAKRSHSQTQKAYRLLRTILNTAVSDGILSTNPCQIRGAGVEHAAERPIIEPAEIYRLAGAIRPHLRALVLVAGFAGLRRGELLALRRRDVDLLHRTITVERQAIKVGKNRVETGPKSRAGARTRPMPPFLAEELERHMDAHTPVGKESLVFVGEKGGPLSTSSLAEAWDEARTKLGLTNVTLHDLRHASGTIMAWTGATTRELMEHLGHSTSAASLRYQHAAASRAEELAQRLDAIGVAARDEPTEAPTPIDRAKSATKTKNRRPA